MSSRKSVRSEQSTMTEIATNHQTSPDGDDAGLLSLLLSGQWSDLTIKCSDRSWKAHRAIIEPQSANFHIVDGIVEDGVPLDATLTLAYEDPILVDCMIRYFYTLDCPLPYPSDMANNDENAIGYAKIYVIAETYKIRGLKTAAASKLEQLLTSASFYDSPLTFVEQLLEIVYEHASTADGTLRAIIRQFFSRYREKLLVKSFVQSYALENNDFGHDLLQSIFAAANWDLGHDRWGSGGGD